MNGNVSGNDLDFDDGNGNAPPASELLFTPQSARDARRMVEDRLEEMRLRKELMDYEYDF